MRCLASSSLGLLVIELSSRSEKCIQVSLIGLACYSSKAPFNLSMMVHCCKHSSQEDLRPSNAFFAEWRKAMVMEAAASLPSHGDSCDLEASANNERAVDDLVNPAD